MTNKTETWTPEEGQRFFKSGMTPEQWEKLNTKAMRTEERPEREFQSLCEQELSRRGYRRMTQGNVLDACGKKLVYTGWFSHWPARKTKEANRRQPFMPDLVVENWMQTCQLKIELKVRDKWQPGQKEMVDMNIWYVAWSFDEFREILARWERANRVNNKGES